ncbi:hypothetical protein ACFXP3_02425 [Streptomyces sp. NPDC059096]|uniref:hypothetical protein n=1 Tax=Streptomyces sp. NPDC059096 TaxID=3346727 RepID=UPI0036BD4CBD
MAEQRQTSAETVLTRIGQAAMLLHGGDREEARNRFGELWAEIGESGKAFDRCTLAHYMADTQDDPGDELAWDLRALTAVEGQDTGAGECSSAARAFLPSLHLNLAADYLELQRPEAARLHLDRARDAADALGAAGYGNGIRTGIDRLERWLASGAWGSAERGE